MLLIAVDLLTADTLMKPENGYTIILLWYEYNIKLQHLHL